MPYATYSSVDSARDRYNTPIILAVGLLHLSLLFVLPFLVAQSLWWVVPFLLLSWVNITHWALIHEAIHTLLHPSPETNERLGRGLSILFGASFHVLRFGHLMHHKLNRHWCSEYRAQAGLRARMKYYYDLLLGLYVSEVTTSLTMAALPRRVFMRIVRLTVARLQPEIGVAGERFFYARGHVRMVRADMAVSGVLHAASFLLYGVYWPVLAGLLLVRGAIISFFDNIYHYDTPADNSKAAKELMLPSRVSRLLLHGNYHETHHLNPQVPWYGLPALHRLHARRFDGGLAAQGLRQFRGPIAVAS